MKFRDSGNSGCIWWVFPGGGRIIFGSDRRPEAITMNFEELLSAVDARHYVHARDPEDAQQGWLEPSSEVVPDGSLVALQVRFLDDDQGIELRTPDRKGEVVRIDIDELPVAIAPVSMDAGSGGKRIQPSKVWNALLPSAPGSPPSTAEQRLTLESLKEKVTYEGLSLA
jgi:hypothetical protein